MKNFRFVINSEIQEDENSKTVGQASSLFSKIKMSLLPKPSVVFTLFYEPITMFKEPADGCIIN